MEDITIDDLVKLEKELFKRQCDLDIQKAMVKHFIKKKKTEQLSIAAVSKCDCSNNIACKECGEEKGLDGDFWKRMKEQ